MADDNTAASGPSAPISYNGNTFYANDGSMGTLGPNDYVQLGGPGSNLGLNNFMNSRGQMMYMDANGNMQIGSGDYLADGTPRTTGVPPVSAFKDLNNYGSAQQNAPAAPPPSPPPPPPQAPVSPPRQGRMSGGYSGQRGFQGGAAYQGAAYQGNAGTAGQGFQRGMAPPWIQQMVRRFAGGGAPPQFQNFQPGNSFYGQQSTQAAPPPAVQAPASSPTAIGASQTSTPVQTFNPSNSTGPDSPQSLAAGLMNFDPTKNYLQGNGGYPGSGAWDQGNQSSGWPQPQGGGNWMAGMPYNGGGNAFGQRQNQAGFGYGAGQGNNQVNNQGNGNMGSGGYGGGW